MSYKEKPLLKIYKFENNSFKLQAIIDDYMSCSWERNKYKAGQFSIEINFNIPNSQIFQKDLFIQFGNDKKDFGVITKITDSIGQNGKGSQIRKIFGYDARFLLKRRIVRNLNSGDSWKYSGNGELCIRNLIKDQCGESAEEKRKLPIKNVISETGIGYEYSVSEAFSNLYETCVTIATQTEIGWEILFENGELNLNFYEGEDLSKTVKFDTDYDSLASGTFDDTSDSYSNAIYIGGKGSGENRDIYEGEALLQPGYLLLDNGGKLIVGYKSRLLVDGQTPSGLDRFESFDNATSLSTEDEYINESKSMLSQFSQTINLSGEGLAKCPYIYKEQYDVGDIITVAFSNIQAQVQILSITEHWNFGQYDISFEFGKPIQNLSNQLNVLLKKIQSYTEDNKSDSVKWYTLPTDTEMKNYEVLNDVIGFVGNSTGNFKLYFERESKIGAKTYHVYMKQVTGSNLVLTTGAGATLTLEPGTYVTIIYVDDEGNIYKTV